MRTTAIGGRPMRFLKLKEVMEKTALSRSAIYRKMNEDQFPKSISLGDRAVAWVESEVEEWMENILMERKAIDSGS
ncbi:AlpA family transcriptional regulator [Vibrio vulnificus]|nr:AlpA family phage regulatory protein [Vibrio vulnificus]EHU9444046.1 AlpA family transcriptional regulator [Vibrio vulnificus]MCU8498721.1 AlpA family transcriptional regulator [Vibrio vulnificus]